MTNVNVLKQFEDNHDRLEVGKYYFMRCKHTGKVSVGILTNYSACKEIFGFITNGGIKWTDRDHAICNYRILGEVENIDFH